MPRFGTRSLLIVFAVVALWLSTFAGGLAAADLRRSMLLLILVAAVSLAIYARRGRRAFWAAFAVVMVLCGGFEAQRPLNRYIPDFAWQWFMGTGTQPNMMGYSTNLRPSMTASGPVRPTGQIVYTPSPYQQFPGVPARSAAVLALSETLAVGWTFALSAISGYIAAYVFYRTRPKAQAASLTARQIVEQELQR